MFESRILGEIFLWASSEKSGDEISILNSLPEKYLYNLSGGISNIDNLQTGFLLGLLSYRN